MVWVDDCTFVDPTGTCVGTPTAPSMRDSSRQSWAEDRPGPPPAQGTWHDQRRRRRRRGRPGRAERMPLRQV